MEELWRLSPSPVVCFDGDAAGARAAARAADLALPMLAPDRTLQLATLPAGEDPDTLVRRQGVTGFQAILSMARPLANALYDLLRETAGAATPEQRAMLRHRLEDAARRIPDRALGSEYRRVLLDRFYAERNNTPRNVIGRNGTQRDGARFQPPARVHPRPLPTAGRTDNERARILTAILLHHPNLLHDVDHAYAAMALDPALAALREAIRGWADRADVLELGGLDRPPHVVWIAGGCRTSPGGGAGAAARLRVARRDASGG